MGERRGDLTRGSVCMVLVAAETKDVTLTVKAARTPGCNNEVRRAALPCMGEERGRQTEGSGDPLGRWEGAGRLCGRVVVVQEARVLSLLASPATEQRY